jgi:hypothetical protein
MWRRKKEFETNDFTKVAPPKLVVLRWHHFVVVVVVTPHVCLLHQLGTAFAPSIVV